MNLSVVCKLIFPFSPRASPKPLERDSRGDDDAIVEHEHNGRKFMQVHEPIWKWCAQKDKERHHHDSAMCNFRFLCCSGKKFQTHFYANLSTFCVVEWKTYKFKNWKPNNNAAASKHISRGLNSLDSTRWCKQMHLIKLYFHEFRLAIRLREQKSFLSRPTKSDFERNSISFYYLMQLMPITHFNYSGFFGRRVKDGCGREFIPEAIYGTRRMHFIADRNFHPQLFTFHFCFPRPPVSSSFDPKIRFVKMKFDFNFGCFSTCARVREKERTNRRPAWQNSPRME